MLARPGPRGIIARGSGRSYGDPAQNAGGTVARTAGLSRIHCTNIDAGTVTVDAGLRLDVLLHRLLLLGLFLPVVPGTGHVTVGGAIAADVHGKNHPAAGSFGDHIVQMTVQTPVGEFILTPETQPEVFWATVGGMGLTGIITQATLRTESVPTRWLYQRTQRCSDLDQLLACWENTDEVLPHQVAWIDGMARGANLGRSLLSRGAWAHPEHHATFLRNRPRLPRHREPLPAPPRICSFLLNTATVRGYNHYRYRTATAQGVVSPWSFFHPLDSVTDWNRLYGLRGLVQYQFSVPHGQESARLLVRIMEAFQRAGCLPFLAVLKRFGPSSHPYLSFPRPGWTLALDFPAGTPGLAALLDRLDHTVLEAGGRLYLAKDSRSCPDVLAQMYPDLAKWRQVRSTVDPASVLDSDQARRLRSTVEWGSRGFGEASMQVRRLRLVRKPRNS
ncbi:FAD-binding oxidoreductase, partial [Streptomyces sp. NPDC005574]|uniref:FAD-binding oxidoreductase n=1 Tax=Streptomyces sp. NPDC005574 TaxID=3156891 RepID=UPI0033B68745